jgi:methylamine dehydrogenase heavy chain
MHIVRLLALLALLTLPAAAAASASAPIPTETAGRAVLPEPQPSWFLALDYGGAAYVFDGADGDVKGTISHSAYTTAIVTLPSRKEAYLVDSYYSRLVRGTRTDVLTIVDMTHLTTKAEIQLPAKTATLLIRGHIGLLNDERHVAVFNMTPAQSVSIVDVVERKFVGEISTAGCAIVMPVELRSFLMLCGDGTLQLIQLAADGSEAGRQRSKPFFDVNKDPVFSQVLYTGTGWLLATHNGSVREARVVSGRIEIGDAWSMLNDEDRQDGNGKEQWRAGGLQPFALHRGSALLYALMHKGKVDTHGQDGKEIWVFDTSRRRRVARLALPFEGRSVLVSQEPVPRVYLCDKDHKLHIYDGYKLKLQRSIDESGLSSGALLQALMPYD